MYNLFTYEIVIAALLATTFVCVGLLAVWAAKSTRHWFLRAGVVFAVLSPLLIFPSHELFLTFALAIALTCSLVAFDRWGQSYRARRESGATPTRKPKFSLASALLVTATLAVSLAVAVHVPPQTWSIWPSWTICGALLSVAYSEIPIFCVGRRWRWQIRSLLFVGAVAAASPIFIFCGRGLYALTAETPFATAFGLQSPANYVLWCGVALIAVFTFAAILKPCGLSTSVNSQSQPSLDSPTLPHIPRWRRLALWGLLLAIAFPPALTMWELTHPLPIPREEIPRPNGIRELQRIGDKVSQSTVIKLAGADDVDYDRLATAVAAQSADYDEIAVALKIPAWIRSVYDYSYFNDMEKLSNRRNIARLLAARSDVAIRANNMEDAFQTHCQMLQTVEAMHQGGLAVDFLVATAIDLMAYEQIFKSIDALNKQQCLAMQRELMASDNRRRGIDDVLYREHVFMQRSTGWVGHLTEFIERICTRRPSDWRIDEGVISSHRRSQAITRLLVLKLAIRAYVFDHGELPAELTQLVPDYLPSLPIDPNDPAGGSLRYLPKADTYLLYSLGDDGDDDNGRQASTSELGNMMDTDPGDGDLSLEDYFAEKDDASNPAPAATSNPFE